MLTKTRLTEILENIQNVKIGIIGDFCVDIYWNADMTKSEISRETPHFPLPIVTERVYPGAAGNAANNIAALNPKTIKACTIIGNDWRGDLLKKELSKRSINNDFFIVEDSIFTYAYCKPMRKGISEVEYEDPRLDFANFKPISALAEEKAIANLKEIAKHVDILCVSDQFEYGIVTDNVRAEIIKLAQSGLKTVVDSRYNIGKYTNCILKPNEVESWRAVYNNEGYRDASDEEFIETAKELSRRNSSTVIQTLGSKGSLVTDGENVERINAVKLSGAIDICGAGDTFLSAFSCSLAAGATYAEAAGVASLASAVTVQKIGVTGTASAFEILNQYSNI